MTQVSYSRIVLLTLVVLGVLFTELGSARLWDRDEPRNSRASHEMLARGDWIVPTFNGSLRDHKPVLLYWGQMLSYLALGESEFTARLPSVLCAILTVVGIAILGSRLSGKSTGLSHEGFWAAGCLATCLLFVMAGRAATPDSCLIAFSTLGIAALVSGSLAPSPPYSSGRVTKTRWLAASVGYLMLGLAALAKGPVGIILPLAVVHVWWLICRRLQRTNPQPSVSASKHASATQPKLTERITILVAECWRIFNPWQCLQAVWALRAIPGILLSLLAAAPWYAAVGLETDGAFLRGFFLDHNVGRALGSMEGHSGSVFFYPLTFLVGTFPWSLWLIPMLAWCRSASANSVVHRQMNVLAAVWVAVYVLAFSMASTKLPSYITPCYAGAALAMGGYWRQFESAWSRPKLHLRRIAYGLTILVGVSISIGIVCVSNLEAMPLLTRAALGGAVVACVGIACLILEHAKRASQVPVAWLVGAAAFQMILFGYGSKSVDAYRSDLGLLSHIAASDAAAPQRWLSIGGMEPSWVHYLGTPIVEVTDSVSEPAAWQQVGEFLERFPDGHVVVVGDEAHERLMSWQQDAQNPALVEVASGPRFLRPGSLRIFELPRRVVAESDRPQVEAELSVPIRTATAPTEFPNPLRPQ